MAEPSFSTDITDLTNYFVIKKYPDGWLVSKNNPGERPIFLQNEKLISMGYLNEETPSVRHPSPPPAVILVPTAYRRSRSELNENWRKK